MSKGAGVERTERKCQERYNYVGIHSTLFSERTMYHISDLPAQYTTSSSTSMSYSCVGVLCKSRRCVPS